MISAARLAWLQLTQQKLRFVVALAGVAFAVILILMQMGFEDALYRSAVTVHSKLDGDVILINGQSSYLVKMEPFTRRRLHQASGYRGVADVKPVRAFLANWEHPDTGDNRPIFVLGIDPVGQTVTIPGVQENLDRLRYPDTVLFDVASRPEYGPVAERIRAGEAVSAEVNQRRMDVRGLFELGTSFGIDGTLILSDQNFMRLFPDRPAGLIEIGVIELEDGADADVVRAELEAGLPDDVEVLTKQGFMEREKAYWQSATPIGFVFRFGVIMGLVVGAIIVYQILFADISDHLSEYATLKAMGYTSGFLIRVVLMEALILALLGYVPGVLVCTQLYSVTQSATLLPLELTTGRAIGVLGLTVAMCWVSALIAVRKVRSADPAEIF